MPGWARPESSALNIAESKDEDLQKALHRAYEEKMLQGKALFQVRKLVEQRRILGPGMKRAGTRGKPKASAEKLVRAYEKEAQKQRLFLKKSKICETKIMFVTSALKELFADENFVTLLRAEGLLTIPRGLAGQIGRAGTES